MKRILTAVTTLLSVLAMGQDNAAIDKFISNYADRGMSGFGDSKQASLVGKPMPDFYFNEQLNSKALKGKSIVLDFWATWCGGCLLLSRDLDSLMIETTDAYKNVQIIGVNTKEKLADKGYNARDYWKKTGKRFPMVDGAVADSCGASVDNGFPTVMLVDPQGIIRGRWDAWTPSTANVVRINTWRYSVLPGLKDMPVTVASARTLMKKNDWISALYFLESLPETDTVSLMKLTAMLHVSVDKAASYAAELKAKTEAAKNHAVANGMLTTIVASRTDNVSLLQTGIAVCNILRRVPEYANTSDFWANNAQLRLRFAQTEKVAALRLLEQAMNMIQKDKAAVYSKEQLQEMKNAFSK